MVENVRNEAGSYRGLPVSFWRLWLGTLISWVGRFLVPLMSVYLSVGRGYPVGTTAALVACYGAGSLVASLLAGPVTDALGHRSTVVAGLLGSAVLTVGLIFATGVIAFAAVVFVFGVVGAAGQVAGYALVAELVEPDDRPRAYAWEYWGVNLGFALAPIVGAALAQRSYRLMFLGQAALALVAAAVVAGGRAPSRPARRARRPAGSRAVPTGWADPPFRRLIGLNLLFQVVYIQSVVTLPLVMLAQGLRTADYATLLTLNGLVVVALQIPASRWLARWSRPRVLVAAALLNAAGFGGLVLAHWCTIPVSVIV